MPPTDGRAAVCAAARPKASRLMSPPRMIVRRHRARMSQPPGKSGVAIFHGGAGWRKRGSLGFWPSGDSDGRSPHRTEGGIVIAEAARPSRPEENRQHVRLFFARDTISDYIA